MSKPDPSAIFQNALNNASPDAHLSDHLPDLSAVWQNASTNAPTDPTSHWTPTNPQTPNSLSQADLHAGGGLINDASVQVDPHLPALVTLTGHDWFVS